MKDRGRSRGTSEGASHDIESRKQGEPIPDSWRVRAIDLAKSDGRRLFRRNPTGLAAAIDCIRALCCFPDHSVNVEGQALDLEYGQLQGEAFFKLKVDDAAFGGRSLRVFFWPDKTRRTIWVLGGAWRRDAYRPHMLVRIRGRLARVAESK